MLTQRLETRRVVAFVVSLLSMILNDTLTDTFTSPYTQIGKDICQPALLLVTFLEEVRLTGLGY